MPWVAGGEVAEVPFAAARGSRVNVSIFVDYIYT